MAVNLNAEPLVSIIVPVFNGERYLRESLDSILGQTYPRTEVLVMDDASTDGTPRILASYGNNVRYRRQRENRGIYGNSNDGIAVARGELVAVYHADDVYLPTVVEREVRFLLDHPEVLRLVPEEIRAEREAPRPLRIGRIVRQHRHEGCRVDSASCDSPEMSSASATFS